MKLDPDLVRELLLWGERELPSNSGELNFPAIDGFGETEIAYNCLLANEAGFFESIKVQSAGEYFVQAYPRKLTYQGHQYLETIRDDKIWAKAKEGATKIGSFSLETLGTVAKAVVAVQIKKYTGLEIDD